MRERVDRPAHPLLVEPPTERGELGFECRFECDARLMPRVTSDRARPCAELLRATRLDEPADDLVRPAKPSPREVLAAEPVQQGLERTVDGTRRQPQELAVRRED